MYILRLNEAVDIDIAQEKDCTVRKAKRLVLDLVILQNVVPVVKNNFHEDTKS